MGVGRRTQPPGLALASIGIASVVTVFIVFLVVRGGGDTSGTTVVASPTPTPAETSGPSASQSASAGLTPSASSRPASSRPPTPLATPTPAASATPAASPSPIASSSPSPSPTVAPVSPTASVPPTASPVPSGSIGPPGSALPGDLLPDLRLATLQDIHLETMSDGHYRLRAGTIAVNVGKGAFAVRGVRHDSTEPLMVASQRIFDTHGGSRFLQPTLSMQYQGDGHNHWHLLDFLSLELYRQDDPTHVFRLRKLGYCLIDEVKYRPELPGSPRTRRFYGQTGCGSPDSLVLKSGISVGWGDVYPADFVLQWIDLPADTPAGRYRLCGTMDPDHRFLELDTTNNSVWHDLVIDPKRGTVRQVGKGWTSCRPG